MTAAPARTSAALASVYDGQRCCGFIVARGPAGFGAFDASERSLGIFETQLAAADAIMRRSAP